MSVLEAKGIHANVTISHLLLWRDLRSLRGGLRHSRFQEPLHHLCRPSLKREMPIYHIEQQNTGVMIETDYTLLELISVFFCDSGI